MTGFLAYQRRKAASSEQLALERAKAEKAEADKPKDKIEGLLKVDLLGIEMGYGLIRYVDASQGGDFLDRIKSIRRQIALDMGLIVPPVHITDNLQLNPRQYAILLKGVQIARGELVQDHLLAINPGTAREEIQGVATVEPAFGLQARWIKAQERERAQLAGYTLVDPATVLATHLTEIIKSQAYELLGRQETKSLLDTVAKTHPKVVEELVPEGAVDRRSAEGPAEPAQRAGQHSGCRHDSGDAGRLRLLYEKHRRPDRILPPGLGPLHLQTLSDRGRRPAGIHGQPGSGKEHRRRSGALRTGILSGAGTSPGQRHHGPVPPHG